jgi:hypothetical protein
MSSSPISRTIAIISAAEVEGLDTHELPDPKLRKGVGGAQGTPPVSNQITSARISSSRAPVEARAVLGGRCAAVKHCVLSRDRATEGPRPKLSL